MNGVTPELVRDITQRIEESIRPGATYTLRAIVERELRKVWSAAYKAGRTDERAALEGDQ